MKKVLDFFRNYCCLIRCTLAFLTNMQNKEKVAGNPYGKDTLESATVDLLDDENYQNIILPEELEAKLAAKEDVTVYFFQSSVNFVGRPPLF